ncbi:MAG: hypothetical protein H7070_13585 [Saprospiraceae bacterium]|nr:hypothetical protein [Pyrinomonadaceae bacterium]
MIENIPSYINWCFALITAATVIFYLSAVSKTDRRAATITGVVLAALLGLHAVLAYTSFYTVKTVPPRFFLTLLPSTVILLILFFAFTKNVGSFELMRLLTLLSSVRVPVEIVLLGLYREGHVPQLMTFEGRNFDIISGVTAPLAAWLAFRGGKINRPLLIGWNLAAFGLLLNILINAVLALETPFQQFAFDQPNRAVLYFPVIWLPAIVVPIVFVSHIASLWQLLFRSSNETV